MPLRFSHSPLHEDDEARIEIVPLIDIMFFLLASMMLISLGAVRLKTLKAELPTAVAGEKAKDEPPSLLTVTGNGLFLDGKPLAKAEAPAAFAALRAAHPGMRLLVAMDKKATGQDLVDALALARQAGIDKIAFATEEAK